MRIEDAIEVFGQGFTFTRSFTHPYLFERVGPLWVMRDAPRKKPPYRNEEWLVYGVNAAEAEKTIHANCRDRYAICAFRTMDKPDQPLRDSYKSLGYRLGHTEMFFSHDLQGLPNPTCDYLIEQVTDQEMADSLGKAAGTRQILPGHLSTKTPRLRQYVALDGGTPIGWVRSITCGSSAWCSNMYVKPSHRRQGIAKALMTRMLLDDKKAGLKENVLLASHTGALLYSHLGYCEIGQ